MAGHCENLAIFEGPPVPKLLGYAPPPQCPHFSLPLRTPLSPQLVSVGLLGANPNTRSALEGHFPKGLAPQIWGLRTTKPQCETHPVTRPPYGPIGAPRLIQH